MTPESSMEKVELLNYVGLPSSFIEKLDDISVLGGFENVNQQILRASELVL